MIRSFSIRNFKSILDLKLNFTYNEGKAPPRDSMSETLAFLQTGTSKRDRYVPILAIYGANASGKTNLIEAFQCFRAILMHGISEFYAPNKLNRKYDSCQFTLDFSILEKHFRYLIEYNKTQLLCEKLSEVTTTSSPQKEDILFYINTTSDAHRTENVQAIATQAYPESRLQEAIRVECSNAEGRMVRPFLWCLVRSFAGLFPLASAIWEEIHSRLHVFDRNAFFLSQGIELLAGSDSDEARSEALRKITTLLKKFDFGIQNISLLRQKIPKCEGEKRFPPEGSICRNNNDSILVDEYTSRHLDTEGHLIPFNFMLEESDGTKVIAGLLGVALWALEKGKTIVIDELDRSLHPFILTSLVKLFKSRRYNKLNAQLIFTLHDPTLLDDNQLRISEVAIINKTLKDGTTCRRICDFEKTRNVLNFRKRYLEGLYAGIPFPYI